MMVPVTGAHGARRARLRRALASHLKREGAVSPDRAIVVERHGAAEEQVFSRMLRSEVIRPGLKGGYWLDTERYAECRRRELILVVGMFLVMGGIMACLLLYTKPQHRNRHGTEIEVVVP